MDEYNKYTYKKDISSYHNPIRDPLVCNSSRRQIRALRLQVKKKKEKEKKRTHQLHGAWNYDMWVNYLVVSATRA